MRLGLRTRLISVAILIAVSLCIQGCERKLPVVDADKAILLRVQELVPYGYKFSPIEKFETFQKRKIIDGSYELEYEFETPDGEKRNALYLYVLATVNKKRSDAQVSQATEKLALLKGLNAKGIQEEEIPNFYSYGDSSSFYVLKKNGVPVGNYFTLREGPKNYTLLLTGMYFDDPEVWKELMEPKLKQFSVYKPA